MSAIVRATLSSESVRLWEKQNCVFDSSMLFWVASDILHASRNALPRSLSFTGNSRPLAPAPCPVPGSDAPRYHFEGDRVFVTQSWMAPHQIVKIVDVITNQFQTGLRARRGQHVLEQALGTSPHQKRLGRPTSSGLLRRAQRFRARGKAWRESVVVILRLAQLRSISPFCFIKRATLLRLVRIPCSRKSS